MTLLIGGGFLISLSSPNASAVTQIPLTFEQGAVGANGALDNTSVNVPNRIRSQRVSVAAGTTELYVTCNSGYSFAIWRWNTSDAFISSPATSFVACNGSPQVWTADANLGSIIVVVRTTAGTAITPADTSGIVVTTDLDLPAPSSDTLTPNVAMVQNGGSVTLTVTAISEQTVVLSDGGMGGTFTPSGVVIVAGDNYTATATYTPARPGAVTISASFADETLTTDIFVSPYRTTIGFIGDSITYGTGAGSSATNAVATTCAVLGLPISSCLNAGVGNAGTNDFADDAWSSNGNPAPTSATKPMTYAESVFGGKVDIVHIMLGANDAEIGNDISTDAYRANLQTMVDKLKASGVRQVIVSYPIYFGVTSIRNANSQALNLSYQSAIDDVIAANGGYVLLGDTAGYDWFQANNSFVGGTDLVHPNAAGHVQLGEFWAGAIMSDLAYQVNPDHAWVSDVNSHQLGDSATLTCAIDKYFGEFANVVMVDGIAIPADAYIATADNTNVELTAKYLNTLSAGEHTLTVGFNGGVSVTDDFTITPAEDNDNTTEPGDNTDKGHEDNVIEPGDSSDNGGKNNNVTPTAPNASTTVKILPPNTGFAK